MSNRIEFYKRNEGTSLSFIGNRICRELSKDFDILQQNIGEEIINYNNEHIQTGICYGMPRDLLYLRRNKKRYAGLVCEASLNNKEIEVIRETNLDEIWIPSKFCEEKFRVAGFNNLRIVPHGIDEVPIGKCLEDNILMVFTSYPDLTWSTTRKNPFMAIEAANRFGKKLILRTEKQTYYKKFDLSNIEFVNYLDNLDDLYDKCSCVLYPSDSEGFGLIGLEALVRGIPLISTRTGNDYLEGMSYIHIDLPVTTEKIYDALIELYNNWSRYSELAINQRQIVLDKYRWSNIINNIKKEVLWKR